MTIKNKLLLVAASIVIAMTALTLLLNYALNRVEFLRNADNQVAAIEVDMLTLRRHEKDYLARLALKYRDAFGERSTIIEENLAALTTAAVELGIESETVNALSESLKMYAARFDALTALLETIGLDEKSGLYGSLRAAVHKAEQLIRETGDYHLLAEMLNLRRNEKDFMLRQDLKYLVNFDGNFDTLIGTLSAAPVTEAQQRDIQSSMQQYRKNFHALVDASREKGLTAKDGKLGELRSTVHTAEGLITEMSNSLHAELSASRTALKSTMIMTAVVITLVLVLAVITVMRSVVRRLSVLDTRMRDIAEGEGDLTQMLDESGNDEIAWVGRSFNRFVGKIHKVVSDLRSASLTLADSSDQISRSSSHSLTSMQQLKSETEQVATAMTEMTATVADVARNVESAAQAAQNSDSEAQHGQNVVTGTISSINGLASEVKQAAAVIEKLAADSQDIGGILDVIRGIADQTNLLALNAAIEAARAGEQGRGFAVVADEVRTLAQKSQESTEEIQRMIEQLQTGASNAVRVMESGRKLAEKSVQEAEAAGSSLESITRAARTISDLNTQIASAAEEQSAVTDEIDRNINNISQAAEETTQQAQGLAATSGDLAHLMSDLNRLVKQFRIAEESGSGSPEHLT